MPRADLRSDVRAADADREAAAERLREHAAAGRLTVDELEERLSRTFGARTYGDLAVVEADLPAPRRPRRRPRAEVRAYLAVHALLIVLWATSGFGDFWPMWSMLGWGIPLWLRYRSAATRSALTAPSRTIRHAPLRS